MPLVVMKSPRLDDKVLHANSIRGKSAALNAKSPDGVLSRL
jgi:hypothetical protein